MSCSAKSRLLIAPHPWQRTTARAPCAIVRASERVSMTRQLWTGTVATSCTISPPGRPHSGQARPAYASGVGADKVEPRLLNEEALGVAGSALDTPQPHHRQERLVVPPVATDLRWVDFRQQLGLAPGEVVTERHVVGHPSEVSVPLGDLVVEDERVAPDRRNQLGQQSVVLVAVVRPRRKDQVGRRATVRRLLEE